MVSREINVLFNDYIAKSASGCRVPAGYDFPKSGAPTPAQQDQRRAKWLGTNPCTSTILQ